MRSLKIIFIFLFAIIYSSNALSEEYFVNGFESSIGQAYGLPQDQTGYNYSCGPTSISYIDNFWYYKNGGHFPNQFSAVSSSRRYIQELYKDGYNSSSIPLNRSSGLSTDELKEMIRDNRSDWVAVKANGSNSISFNLSLAKNWIDKDYPLIIALEGNFSGNPIYGFPHIVVVYGYDKDSIYYFDPYYGTLGNTISSKTASIANAVQGNFPYLRIAPK